MNFALGNLDPKERKHMALASWHPEKKPGPRDFPQNLQVSKLVQSLKLLVAIGKRPGQRGRQELEHQECLTENLERKQKRPNN